ncbi:MAG: hypothetical protein KAS32_11550, partial [Candidatus Peribacteraceae bacterium]|nr:hypothetical protein [Candidatus Peribacteraceae bacterium]
MVEGLEITKLAILDDFSRIVDTTNGVREAVDKLITVIKNPDLDLVVRHAISLKVRTLLEAVENSNVPPQFVVDTATPIQEKPYEGMSYEMLMKLLEQADIISRGVGTIWKGGGYVWLGNGMRIKEEIFGGFENILDEFGYEPFQIPSELPREVIDAVNEGVVNLEEGTYWLAELRDGELRNSGLYANSSNDAVVSYFLANRARAGGKILPFRGYSRHQIIRSHKDSANTKAFLNSDENYECFEAYSIHETSKDCEIEFQKIIEIMQEYFNKLGISFLTVDQSNWGNKPVAKKVTSLQTFASQVRGSVRLATIYMHDDTFSRLFDLSTKMADGSKEFAHQVGYGLWEGLMVPLFDHLSDKYGLCIPPNVAAHQLVFVPRDEKEEKKILELEKLLNGYRIKIDRSYQKRFIKRLNKHRTEGVPLRCTFNEDGDKVVLSRRDTLQTHEVDPLEFVASMPHFLKSIGENYAERSKGHLENHVAKAGQIEDIQKLVNSGKLV